MNFKPNFSHPKKCLNRCCCSNLHYLNRLSRCCRCSTSSTNVVCDSSIFSSSISWSCCLCVYRQCSHYRRRLNLRRDSDRWFLNWVLWKVYFVKFYAIDWIRNIADEPGNVKSFNSISFDGALLLLHRKFNELCASSWCGIIAKQSWYAFFASSIRLSSS